MFGLQIPSSPEVTAVVRDYRFYNPHLKGSFNVTMFIFMYTPISISFMPFLHVFCEFILVIILPMLSCSPHIIFIKWYKGCLIGQKLKAKTVFNFLCLEMVVQELGIRCAVPCSFISNILYSLRAWSTSKVVVNFTWPMLFFNTYRLISWWLFAPGRFLFTKDMLMQIWHLQIWKVKEQ